jgi:uncharacterized protein (TIGR02266 family)
MLRSKDEQDVAARVIDRTTATAQVVVTKSTGHSSPPGVDAESERRVKPRFAVAMSVTLVGDHNFYMGLTENLSEGGLFVQTQRTLPIGTSIRVEFSLPTSNVMVSCVGVVRWVRSANAVRKEHNNFGSGGDEAFKPGMGIQFTALTPENVKVITKFISIRKPEFYLE